MRPVNWAIAPHLIEKFERENFTGFQTPLSPVSVELAEINLKQTFPINDEKTTSISQTSTITIQNNNPESKTFPPIGTVSTITSKSSSTSSSNLPTSSSVVITTSEPAYSTTSSLTSTETSSRTFPIDDESNENSDNSSKSPSNSQDSSNDVESATFPVIDPNDSNNFGFVSTKSVKTTTRMKTTTRKHPITTSSVSVNSGIKYFHF